MDLLQHTLFINLIHRTDRLEHVLEEFKKLNITGERFSAIKTASGNIGCTLSHIKCLELAKQREYPFVFICEDDIQFTNPQVFLENLEKFYNMYKSGFQWDVLIVGGNTCPPFQPVNEFCVRVYNVQTTTGYIVQKHYYDKLIDNFKDGLQRLIREPNNKKIYSIDIHWKHLQTQDNWFITIPLTVNQYYDYSDIEEKVVDYTQPMLDLEKKEIIAFLQKQKEKEKEKEKEKRQKNIFNMSYH
jgi:GR25 family glycosyltransferase involved in LPS biosynthesis